MLANAAAAFIIAKMNTLLKITIMPSFARDSFMGLENGFPRNTAKRKREFRFLPAIAIAAKKGIAVGMFAVK